MINTPKNKAFLVMQGRVLKVKVQHSAPPNQTIGFRGKIVEFSPQSRKRMIDLLARIDVDNAGFVCFVTLTYPNRNGPPDYEATERDRRTFFKRMRRRFPEAAAVWRREYEPRKTGEFAGAVFPHYHILFFGLPFLDCEELNRIWREVIGYDDYVRTEIKGMESWKQAMYYLSKYMAKPVDFGVTSSGLSKPGGDAAAPDAVAPAGGEAACSLVNGTYMTGDDENDKNNDEINNKTPSVGRSWGVFNRKFLPIADIRLAALDGGDWLEDAKDIAAGIWDGVNNMEGYGFTLYLDDIEQGNELFDQIKGLADRLPTKPDDDIPF